MINKLIEKYITQFNERQYKLNLIDYHLKKEPYKQSLLDERHDIERDISKYNEFIKDLEELKEKTQTRKNSLLKREKEKKDIAKLYVMGIADIIEEIIGE